MSSNQQALLMVGGDGSTPPVAICVADPYYDTPDTGDVVFLMHADGADGSSTFTDVSASANTCTAQNGITVTTSNPKFGTGSVLSSGSGGAQVNVTSSTDLSMGSGDFTVECWAALTSVSGLSRGIIGKGNDMYNTTMGFYIFVESSSIRARICNGTTFLTLVGGIVFGSLDTYIHVALVRSGNDFTLYANGAEAATGTLSGSLPTNSDSMYIAGNPSENGIIGLIDEVRVTKGTALYTGSTYTIPTAAFSDSSTSQHTVLSLHGESIVDSSSEPKTLTNNGATISSAQSQFGTNSISFVGASSQYLSCGASPDYTMAGDFTFEFWAKEVSGNNCWWSTATANTPYFYDGEVKNILGAGVHLSYGSATIAAWTQFLISRSGSTVRVFRSGALVSSGTYAGTLDFVDLELGRYKASTNLYLTGYIDDLRLTKGVARETVAFTPPTMTFCDSETATFVGQASGTDYPIGQQLTISQGTLTVTNPWVKLSGIELLSSAGTVAATLPNKIAALMGTSTTVSAGTVLTSSKVAALTGVSASISQGRLYIPPYPDFTRVPTPTGYGVTVQMTSGGDADIQLLLNADGTISVNVLIGTLVSETVRPAVWVYNSFPNGYVIENVVNAYYLQESTTSGRYGGGGSTHTSTVAMGNGVDMSLGGSWEVEYSSPTNKPATFTKIIITGPLSNNPRYGEFNYYGIFYFTITMLL